MRVLQCGDSLRSGMSSRAYLERWDLSESEILWESALREDETDSKSIYLECTSVERSSDVNSVV